MGIILGKQYMQINIPSDAMGMKKIFDFAPK
jgi:hypothetical protein